MSASFKIRKAISCVPTETVTLSDGVQTITTIDSNIEKSIGGFNETGTVSGTTFTQTLSPSDTGYYFINKDITVTSYTSLQSLLSLSGYSSVYRLIIVNKENLSSNNGLIILEYDDGVNPVVVLGTATDVGDFIILDGIDLDSNYLKVKAFSSTYTSNCDIYIYGANT